MGSIMPSSEEYKHMAIECLKLAAQTPDLVEREELTRMATSWITLAEYKAKIERADQPSASNRRPF